MYATRDNYYPQPARRSRLSSSQRPRRQAQGHVSRFNGNAARAPQSPQQTPQRTVQPTRPRPQRRNSRSASRAAGQRHVADLTRETFVKLSINTVLIGLSATALAKLVPSHLTQRSQLREIRSELSFTQARVDKLRTEFSRTFDPMQAQSVMQQQSHLIDPNQRPVVFTPQISTLNGELD